MRTYSTPESALNLEFTKLAIFECVVAVLLYVGIGLYLSSFKYLAVAIVFAPLMLFRTAESALWGLKIYSEILHSLRRFPNWFAVPILLVFGALIGVTIRIIATVFWAIRRPLYTLQETPRNWLRQTVCTDFAHVPEIVPLDAVKGNEFGVPTFSVYAESFAEDLAVWAAITLVFLPFILMGWLPSLVYRISFKATSLVYVPLIWVPS